MPHFKTIVVLDKVNFPENIADLLTPYSENPVEIHNSDPKDETEIIARLRDADCALLTWRTPITEKILDASPSLKFICLCATNSNLIDLESCTQRNIPVSNIKDYGDEGVVEWIFAELINLVRGTNKYQWRDNPSEIGGKALGIIGFGTLGKMVAKIALSFGMKVLYFSKTRNKEYEQKGVRYTEKHELLKQSDFITLQTPRNIQILKAEDFNLMNGKVLINNTLGKAFNEQDFLEWIKKPNNYLLTDMASDFKDEFANLDRVIMSKTVSGLTAEAAERLSQKAIENIEAYLANTAKPHRKK